MHRPILPTSLLLVLASGMAWATLPEVGEAGSERPAPLEPATANVHREALSAEARERLHDLDVWFEAHASQRVHVHTDRPLYRPGDTVQVKVWDLQTRGLTLAEQSLTAKLVDPHGTSHQAREVQTHAGQASLSFPLEDGVAGGTWKVQLTPSSGEVVERVFTVADFQAPRVKKTLDFARDSYGPGERVVAALTLERATGEPLAGVEVTARIQADGVALEPMRVRTNAAGEASLDFTLPAHLDAPDVLLTVLVDDGGVTESISRAVPVVLDRLVMAFFPEGGDLVSGLRSRVYFEVTDPTGAPAEVEGTLVDEGGHEVAPLRTWVDGRGHVSFTPQAGHHYSVRVDAPAEVETRRFGLPEAREHGCVLRHYDDLEGALREVRVGVSCTEAQQVMVLATQQEEVLDRAVFEVRPGRESTVFLHAGDKALAGAQGVARITVFGEDLRPLAERLVYRNRGRQLQVELSPDREHYQPQDEVALRVRTLDPEGRPVPAELALSVVDDALLALADDHGHTLLSQVLLQADLPEPIEGGAELLDLDDPDGGLGLDLVLGTRGWRHFDWTPVSGFAERHRQEVLEELRARAREEVFYDLGDVPAALEDGAGYTVVSEVSRVRATKRASRRGASRAVEGPRVPMREYAAPPAGAEPAEAGSAEQPVVRADFRDTVAWEPVVHTDRSGEATVRFTLSDAVTGFRAMAEGVGGGWLGRGETLISSTLPFHAEARVPVALSAGDELLLPVTVESQQAGELGVDIAVATSELLELRGLPERLSLSEGERDTVFVPMVAREGAGKATITVSAQAEAVEDALRRELRIAPPGFPRSWSVSGTLEGRVAHELAVPEGALPGSIHAAVTVFPSPVSELVEGLEGMVRMPGGCFEQTSSTNYPNVLVLDWLDQTGGGGRLAVDRQRVLHTGYDKLAGYQVGSGGFETWGSGPGKEALSAFGLLQFTDMARVYDVDPEIIEENTAYLYRQRDGEGGFRTSGSSAHGYGTAPQEVLDAYITYALVETGHTDLEPELDRQERLASRTRDPYRLALASLSLLRARPAAGERAVRRLASLQAEDGSFPGSETSITRSENQNLDVEATALAALAMVRAGRMGRAQRAVEFIQSRQRSPGVWGASQANALALKAISTVAQGSAHMDGPGRLAVRVDGEVVARVDFEAGRREPLTVDVSRWMGPGGHELVLTLDGGTLPYAAEVGWSSVTPVSDPSRRLDLSTSLARDRVSLGETDRLTVRVRNRTDAVVPDPIARVGLPAGLEAQTWQLDALKKEGRIAFYETRPREVTLYWDGVHAGETHTLSLDLVATVPGRFTGPASSAYPYYDDVAQSWTEGNTVQIDP